MATVEVLDDSHFFPVFDFKNRTIVLVWSHDTSLKNIVWDRWLIFKLGWPPVSMITLFADTEANVFFPEVGTRLDKISQRR
jgi:hypothetical protein